MKFRNEEEREAYAAKASGLTQLGWAFYIIGTDLEANPEQRFTDQYRNWRHIRCYINELRELGVISCDTEDFFRLSLTEKGRRLLPRYRKAAEVYTGIMNDF